jgi:hypothetical protein
MPDGSSDAQAAITIRRVNGRNWGFFSNDLFVL